MTRLWLALFLLSSMSLSLAQSPTEYKQYLKAPILSAEDSKQVLISLAADLVNSQIKYRMYNGMSDKKIVGFMATVSIDGLETKEINQDCYFAVMLDPLGVRYGEGPLYIPFTSDQSKLKFNCTVKEIRYKEDGPVKSDGKKKGS